MLLVVQNALKPRFYSIISGKNESMVLRKLSVMKFQGCTGSLR